MQTTFLWTVKSEDKGMEAGISELPELPERTYDLPTFKPGDKIELNYIPKKGQAYVNAIVYGVNYTLYLDEQGNIMQWVWLIPTTLEIEDE